MKEEAVKEEAVKRWDSSGAHRTVSIRTSSRHTSDSSVPTGTAGVSIRCESSTATSVTAV